MIPEMHVELDPFYAGLVLTRDMQVIAIQAQARQSVLQLFGVNSQIQQSSKKHVAANPTKNIKIKDFHCPLPDRAAPLEVPEAAWSINRLI